MYEALRKGATVDEIFEITKITASIEDTSAMGNPVALEASADEREVRGLISITMIRSVTGSCANCTLVPPIKSGGTGSGGGIRSGLGRIGA